MGGASEAISANFAALSALVIAGMVGSASLKYIQVIASVAQNSPRLLAATLSTGALFVGGSLVHLCLSFESASFEEVFEFFYFIFIIND